MIKKVIMFLMMLAVVSCGANDAVRIGWIGPLTGDSAAVGIPNLHGAELAVKAINAKGGIDGKPVELVVENDELDYRKLYAN